MEQYSVLSPVCPLLLTRDGLHGSHSNSQRGLVYDSSRASAISFAEESEDMSRLVGSIVSDETGSASFVHSKVCFCDWPRLHRITYERRRIWLTGPRSYMHFMCQSQNRGDWSSDRTVHRSFLPNPGARQEVIDKALVIIQMETQIFNLRPYRDMNVSYSDTG